MSKDNDLDKLGIVLGVANEINRDMLKVLVEQQKRQVKMIWASLGIVLVAFAVVALSMFCAFQSFDRLSNQISSYGGIRYENTQDRSEEIPQD